MGASKKDFQEIREFCIVEMTRDFYEQNESTFTPPDARLKASYVIGESHKGDKTYEEKFERFKAAQEELREYEYQMRYKRYNKID